MFLAQQTKALLAFKEVLSHGLGFAALSAHFIESSRVVPESKVSRCALECGVSAQV